jgi:hypothetical protein
MRIRDKKRGRKPSKIKKLAAAAVVAITVAFSPLTEGLAQEAQPQPPPAAAAERESEDEPASRPVAPAEREDAEPVERPAPPASEVSEPEDAADSMRLDPDIAAALAQAAEYQDRTLSPGATDVNISGRPRGITLDNPWDIGGNLYVNEAGSAVSGSVRYSYRGTRTRRPFDARFDAGNIWFGEHAAPFARLMIRPGIDFWRFRLVYYGSIATMANMPSQLYTSHSVGFGYSQPIGESVRLRLGGVIGGALSYPKYDDIYFNLATGASLEINNFLLYAMPQFYFAAGNPMQTAYVGHYTPRFQDVEFGMQYRFLDDQYTVRAFGNYGTIHQRVGARITRIINFSDEVEGDIWVAGGATHWDQRLGGRWDPMIMIGANIVIGGEHINSTSSLRYEHLQSGGVRYAETDIPTLENPGPYGFGRSGDPEVDAQIQRAKENIMNATNFTEFSNMYAASSRSEVIMSTRFIGAFLQQVAYANNAMDSLYNTDFYNPDVERISNVSTEQMFSFLRQYVNFYNTHSSTAQLPEELRNGIAVCAGISHIQAEHLRRRGVPAIVASVNTLNGPHVVAIGMPEDATHLFDYGNLYTTGPNTFDEAMRFYGRNRGAPTFQSQLFDGNGYIGTYVTSEGRLLHDSIGIVNTRVLAEDFLGVR